MTRYYVTAWGWWFCIINGWVESIEEVRSPVSEPVAKIISEEQPGVTLIEVSA